MVTTRSSTTSSLVRKSAPRRGQQTSPRVDLCSPIVALYWFENRLLTYWFIRDVLPTLDDRDQHDSMVM